MFGSGGEENAAELKRFLTVQEIAGILKLNPQTVRNWISRGTLPAHRIRRRGLRPAGELDGDDLVRMAIPGRPGGCQSGTPDR